MTSHAAPAATPNPATPLLATKLHRPVPRTTAVLRPRLLSRLLAGLRGRLTLIAAPAGFGKSTLLAQALQEAPSAQALQVAWVSLDGGDNDPARFWSYVCAAIERASPGLGAPALALLRTAPMAGDVAIAELLNGLTKHGGEVALVLDDYHLISSPAIHQGVGFLLEHAPPQFHLVIASRVDPPLPLARLRARGELAELRAADLRFTAEEALQFLSETMGLQLDAEAAVALEARTEGWAAGLQIAALSLQGQADMRGFIASFSGSHRHVVDYLAEEVLQRQPEHIRAFLLQTAILDRFSGPLCDAVLGVAQSQAGGDSYSRLILDALERDNLFLIPLDEERRWYRYHHLFADLLRHRLQQERPALVAELHRQAAAWFERHGAPAEAVGHALAAGDTDLLVRLLTAHGARFATSGETQTFQGWLDALPRERLLTSPRLCLAQAWVLMRTLQVVAAETYLAAAEAALAGAEGLDAASARGELLTLRAHMTVERGAYADALPLAREALDLLPPTEHMARSISAFVLGYALYVLGQTTEAIAELAENVRRCRAVGNILHALFSATEVVKLHVLQGRLAEAQDYVQDALGWAAQEGWQQLPPAGALYIWLGNVLMERGEFGAAETQLATAIQLTQHGPAIPAARVQIFLARLRQLQGDTTGANTALAAVERICHDWEPGGERVFFDAYIARLRLLRGDVAAAQRWAAQRAPWDPAEAPSYFREIELLSLARVAILGPLDERSLDGTLAMLGWLRERAVAAGRGAVVTEALALEGLALARGGPASQAHEQLDKALELAAPEGFVGLFADLGAPMAELLAQSLARRPAHDPLRPYLARLLQAFAAGAPTPAMAGAVAPSAPEAAGAAPARAEQLTERELEVLRLFAAGMTSAEIAAHFVVSVNTVKTQLKSIYSKLDTHSRAELVARARALSLMS
jgi:LuxR family maltose regulon positive regulatory protein